MANRNHRRRRRAAQAFVRGGLAAGLVAAGCADTEDTGPRMGSSMAAGSGAPNSGAGGLGGTSVFAGSPAVPVVPPPSLPADFLHDQAVTTERTAQRVLYSWTTDEQYQELRDTPVLLTRSEHPEQGAGLIQQVLVDLAAAGDPLSQALTAPEFQKARYAWPNPWATLMGWPGETYGNKLIRIELREDAWVMLLIGTEWQVVDLQQQPVSRTDAINNPARIGAIYHVHESDQLECGGSFVAGGSGAFREYFLPNESMIASWSLATQEMRARLEADIDLIAAYRDYRTGRGSPWFAFEAGAACAWLQEGVLPDDLPPDAAYLSALALASPAYDPAPENLDALVQALTATLFEPDPLVRTSP